MRRVFKNAIFITMIAMGVSWAITWVTVGADANAMSSDVFWLTLIVPVLVAFPTGIIFEHQKIELAGMNAQLEEVRDALLLANIKLRRKAERDFLTGLPNREAFVTQLHRYLSRDRGGMLLFLDVDHFKRVNDTYGHDGGDKALQLIASALAEHVRPDDLLARVGGEEFVIYLREIAPKESEAVVTRLRHAVSNIAFGPDDKPCTLSISIGGAWCDNAIGFDKALKIADTALYSAKEGGRNCYHYAPEVSGSADAGSNAGADSHAGQRTTLAA